MKQTVDRASAITYFIRGEVCYSDEDFDQAIAESNKAIQHDPNYEEAYLSRIGFAENDNYDQAIKNFDPRA